MSIIPIWRLVVVIAIVLVGCMTDDRALQPLPEPAKAELAVRGLKLGAPLYVRVFKAESEMEVWLGRSDGEYTLFRTYPICNWSGDLGPKTREGDKQAPEGFYMVAARQMNPKSAHYLSFNIGYPNAYDKAHGYTGSALMVHGGCRSAAASQSPMRRSRSCSCWRGRHLRRGSVNFPSTPFHSA